MTANARIVLADCREAHGELVDGLIGSLWRRRWATVVVLLRTIESGRNLLLKEYSFLAGQNATVYVGEGRSDITYSVNDGLYAGEDPRAVTRPHRNLDGAAVCQDHCRTLDLLYACAMPSRREWT